VEVVGIPTQPLLLAMIAITIVPESAPAIGMDVLPSHSQRLSMQMVDSQGLMHLSLCSSTTRLSPSKMPAGDIQWRLSAGRID